MSQLWSIGILAIGATFTRGALFPNNFVDHSLCCGIRGGLAQADPTAAALSLSDPVNAPLAQVAAGAPGPSTKPAPPAEMSTAAPAAATGPALGVAQKAADAKPAPPPEMLEGGYLKLGFEHLANYKISAPSYDAAKPDAPPPDISHLIPASVKVFEGKKAVITGFMLPVKMQSGLVTELFVMRDPMMCCYGVVPQVNEWVVVKMPKGVRSLMDVPVSFYGTLHVKEMYDNGVLTGIYSLDGEKMTDAK